MHDLAAFPAQLRAWLEAAPPELLTKRAANGNFSLLENAWHLADLEVEGYGERLRRLLTEESPSLPDVQGDVVAEARHYQQLPLGPALERFAQGRAANMSLILGANEEERLRSGEQEGVGTVTFERVVAMMAEHDAAHTAELLALRKELGILDS